MMPTVQILAAVALPVVDSTCRLIAPAPINPTPMITPCMMLAWVVAPGPRTDIAVWTKPQLAIATSGKVHRPAPRSSRAVPADRQGQEKCDQQVDEVLEAIAPVAINV